MQNFHKSARACEKAYLDMGDGDLSNNALSSYAGKTNLFWSNVQVVLTRDLRPPAEGRGGSQVRRLRR